MIDPRGPAHFFHGKVVFSSTDSRRASNQLLTKECGLGNG